MSARGRPSDPPLGGVHRADRTPWPLRFLDLF